MQLHGDECVPHVVNHLSHSAAALAAVGRCLCTESVHPATVSAFVARRLIPLDKCPGVRPIGLPRRIIAKAVLDIVRNDITAATSPLQECAGLDGGCEAAIQQ